MMFNVLIIAALCISCMTGGLTWPLAGGLYAMYLLGMSRVIWVLLSPIIKKNNNNNQEL